MNVSLIVTQMLNLKCMKYSSYLQSWICFMQISFNFNVLHQYKKSLQQTIKIFSNDTLITQIFFHPQNMFVLKIILYCGVWNPLKSNPHISTSMFLDMYWMLMITTTLLLKILDKLGIGEPVIKILRSCFASLAGMFREILFMHHYSCFFYFFFRHSGFTKTF